MDLGDRRLVIVSGKGGVGKSAVTASLAMLAARRGKRVLALGMVEDIGLAIHLGGDELSFEPTELQPGVWVSSIDRSAALDEYLRTQLRVPRAAPTKQISRALQVLVDTAPGIREIVSMGKPIYEVWKGTYDLVVVDAPPLGQLISYLRAPATIAGFVPSGVVRDQAERMRITLADERRSGLLIVTTPDELPVLETLQALIELDAEPLIDTIGVVVNRVIPKLPIEEAALATVPAGPHRAAGALHLSLYESQERWMDELPPGMALPFLFGLLTPGEVAARLTDEWDGE